MQKNGVIPLVISTCVALYNMYGVDTDYCIDDTLIKNDLPGDGMTLIMDTFTSGNTLKSALSQMKARTGSYPSNIIVSVDRMERGGTSPLSAKQEIEKQFGVHIHAIVTVEDIIYAIERGIIGGAEYLDKIKSYCRKYGKENGEMYI